MVLEDAHESKSSYNLIPKTKLPAACPEAAGYRFCEKQGYYYKELAAPSA